MDVIGTEAQRQFYLAAAGIRMWYAREALPGAAPSPDFDFAETEVETLPVPEAEVAPVRRQPQAGKGRDHIARLQSLMDGESSPRELSPTVGDVVEPGAPDAEIPVQEPEPAPVASGPDAQPVPNLALQAWAGRRYLLLATLSEQTSLALQESLANNILGALSEARPAALETVRWPLFNNLNIGLNNPSHLVELVTHQLQDHKDKTLIVLGEPGGWLEEALARAPDVGFPASLAGLAGDPQLKRELWTLLKTCRDRS